MKLSVQYLRDKATELRSIAAELDRKADIIEHEPRHSKQHTRHLERVRWRALSEAERFYEACEACHYNPIVRAVMQHFRTHAEVLCSNQRTARLAQIRQIAMYLLYKSGLSTTEVGEMLNRDHSTVTVGNRVIARRMAVPAFRQEINKILDLVSPQESYVKQNPDSERNRRDLTDTSLHPLPAGEAAANTGVQDWQRLAVQANLD